MKRNMDLIREILLAIEARPAGEQIRQIALPPEYADRSEVIEHLRLVYNSGMLEGKVTFTNTHCFMHIHGLSTAGHDLLDSIRDETVWSATKNKVKQVGGGVSIAVLQAVAVAFVKEKLGL